MGVCGADGGLPCGRDLREEDVDACGGALWRGADGAGVGERVCAEQILDGEAAVPLSAARCGLLPVHGLQAVSR